MSAEDNAPQGNEENVEALYNRFKQNIGLKNPDVYFDEDDLIDIYTYADEHFDDFVKMEVLFYGARMFPDSEFMQARRRMMYSDMGNEEAVTTLLKRCDKLSTLDRILLYRQNPDADLDGLKEILAQADKLDDEEVIQFLDELNDDDYYPWLRDNFKLILEKSSDPENTYFNTFLTAKENGDNEFAIQLAEELTMLQPFNIEYLELLASTQYEEGEYTEALSTLEYSLALDPKSTRSLILKANSLAGLDPKSDEAYNILLSLKDDESFSVYGGWEILMGLMMIRNESAKLIQLLKDRCHLEDADIKPLECLMSLDPQHLSEYAPLLKNPEWPDSPDFWFSRAVKFMGTNIKIATTLLSEGFSRHHFINGLDLYLEMLYCARQFDDVIKVYNVMQKYASKMPDCVLLYILALVRTGKVGLALKEAKREVKNLSPDMAANSVTIYVPDNVDEDGLKNCPTAVSLAWMMNIGKSVVFNNIVKALDRPKPLPIDDFDPLINYMEE